MRLLAGTLLSILLGLAASDVPAASLAADLPAGLQVPADARPGAAFDVDKATSAYLALLSPAQRARSDAYFEGGYWVAFWSFAYGLGVALVFLATGLSVRMRDAAERVSRRPWLSTLLYALLWVVASFVLVAPLSIYTDFVREHQ
ncbi:MAG TPA: hypothetical protein VFO24_11760, partial [Usitatibacter sp.]|nr:hypothetical protein [Usitatibacter sp.]